MNSDWHEFSLPEIIDFQEGPGILAKDFTSRGVPLVRLAGLERGASLLNGCNFLCPEMVAQRWQHFRLAEGDVLLSTSASLGRIAVVDDEARGAIPYTGIIRMRPRDGRLAPEFIPFVLRGDGFQRQVEVMGVGSVIRHFGPTHLKRMSVSLPPLNDQRAIASILGALDDKIDLNRRMSETLEAMARALFKSWFVDFDPVRAKAEGRDPGLPKEIADLFPDRLVDSELGEIPEGWEVASLSELVEVVKGVSYRSVDLARSDVALVTLKSFARGGGYRTDGLKSYTGRYKPQQVVAEGEVILACTDVTQAGEVIGRTAVVAASETHSVLVASLDTVILRPSMNGVSPEFVYQLGRTERFVAHMSAHATGTTVLHLSKQAIPKFRLAVPPDELFVELAGVAGRLGDRARSLTRESVRLSTLRDTLLPKLISGELRIPDPERFLKEVAA